MSLPVVLKSGEVKDLYEVSRERAKDISQSGLMPEHFAKNPENVHYVMLIAQSLGIDPVAALSHVHVFEDGKGQLKAGLSADLMVALARNAGHIVHVSSTTEKAIATLVRGDATPEKIQTMKDLGLDPKELFVFSKVFTRHRAEQVGLLGANPPKRNWEMWTQEMMEARVKSAIVRIGCSEVLLGIRQAFVDMGIELTDERDDEIAMATARYTPDELGAETDEEGAPVARSRTVKNPPKVNDKVRDFVTQAPAEKIVQWAELTAKDPNLSDEDKLARLRKVYSTCEELNRLESPVPGGNLETVLKSTMTSFLSKDGTTKTAETSKTA